ncbi:hypothetical protein JCM12141A_37030 [Mycolicibacterium hodleri]
MAKRSKIVKNERRRATVARFAERRAELKRIIRSPETAVALRFDQGADDRGGHRSRPRSTIVDVTSTGTGWRSSFIWT